MEAYYVPMELILRDIRYLKRSEQIAVLEHAGELLDLAYPPKPRVLSKELMLTTWKIIVPLREILIRAFSCGVIEYLYIQIKSRGIIYVSR